MNYVVPYACGFDQDDLPDRIGKLRCDAALKIAQKIPDAVILLGAAMPEYSRSKSVTLASAMARYLMTKGWPREKIFINAKGYEMVSETVAIGELIETLGPGKIIIVNSWHHVPRIKLVWRILFGKGVKSRAVGHKVKLSVSTIIKFALVPFYSAWKAWQWRSQQSSYEDLKQDVIRRNPPKARPT